MRVGVLIPTRGAVMALVGCAKRANVEMSIAGECRFGRERFDPGCIRLIREAAEPLGVPHRDILS